MQIVTQRAGHNCRDAEAKAALAEIASDEAVEGEVGRLFEVAERVEAAGLLLDAAGGGGLALEVVQGGVQVGC